MRRDLAEHVAQVVAAGRRLDLHHVGAEVPEVLSDEVAVEQHGHLEHADPREQPVVVHWCTLTRRDASNRSAVRQ